MICLWVISWRRISCRRTCCSLLCPSTTASDRPTSKKILKSIFLINYPNISINLEIFTCTYVYLFKRCVCYIWEDTHRARLFVHLFSHVIKIYLTNGIWAYAVSVSFSCSNILPSEPSNYQAQWHVFPRFPLTCRQFSVFLVVFIPWTSLSNY